MYSIGTGPFNYILMQDLTPPYTNADESVLLDFEHMKAALKTLAIFHASTASMVVDVSIFTNLLY